MPHMLTTETALPPNHRILEIAIRVECESILLLRKCHHDHGVRLRVKKYLLWNADIVDHL